jgi:hypothetical protein
MKNNFLPVLLCAAVLFSSCQAIGGIFKAGMGFGIFIVIFVIVVIALLIFRRRK